jgi:hypothetical protein
MKILIKRKKRKGGRNKIYFFEEKILPNPFIEINIFLFPVKKQKIGPKT